MPASAARPGLTIGSAWSYSNGPARLYKNLHHLNRHHGRWLNGSTFSDTKALTPIEQSAAPLVQPLDMRRQGSERKGPITSSSSVFLARLTRPEEP
jgi:hypothetical protein